jgi:hypothetical protein
MFIFECYAHTANTIPPLLQEFFGDRNVGRSLGHPDLQTSHHPTYSGDLSRKESIQTVHELKHTVTCIRAVIPF